MIRQRSIYAPASLPVYYAWYSVTVLDIAKTLNNRCMPAVLYNSARPYRVGLGGFGSAATYESDYLFPKWESMRHDADM